jgi:hypothetical protein
LPTTIEHIAAAITSAPEDIPPLIASARGRATDLVEEHWDDIRWIAFCLSEIGTLTGEAVRVALRKAS